jgi:hypothetical protein
MANYCRAGIKSLRGTKCYLPLATHTIIKAANTIIFCFYGGKMMNVPYKMAASTGGGHNRKAHHIILIQQST